MSRKPNQFEEQARIAHTYDLPKDHQRVEHKDNILVYNFLLFAPSLCATAAAPSPYKYVKRLGYAVTDDRFLQGGRSKT